MASNHIGKTLSAIDVTWAYAALLLAIAPHTRRFSIWLMLGFAGMGLWRVLGAYQLVPLPDRKFSVVWLLKQLLAVAIFVATYMSFGGQLGRDAGVAMLTALLGLKLLEMYTSRDYYVVMFLGYFLVVTNLFYSQTIATAVYMFVVVWVVTAGLIHFNGSNAKAHDRGISYRECFRLSTHYLLQAVPLMLIAFFLFPRIPGPLWGVPQNSEEGVTGLSQEMTVGNLSKLGVSDELAFRVDFEGRTPPARALYWRGPVLWHSDGRTWRSGNIGDGPPRQPKILGDYYTYQLMLEAHGEKWVFALDVAASSTEDALLTPDQRLVAQKSVNRRTRYRVTSALNYQLDEITPLEREAALDLPKGFHPQTIALAKQWRAEGLTERSLVNQALQYFNQLPFVYTLIPKPLSGDPMDSFLFDTREGFCEYFASSFVVLMRAAGIPARVVTGYQGGEYNTMSDFMVVRQRDAHAWTEVFLQGEGWVRVDPTAAVAPERVSLGVSELLGRRQGFMRLTEDNPVGFAWHRAHDLLEAVNFNWSRWVLGYSPKKQRQVLEDLGLHNWNYGSLIMALTLCAAFILGFIAWFILRENPNNTDAVLAHYNRFCRKLAHIGLARAPNEGPLDFAKRIRRYREDISDAVSKITEQYAALRYADSDASIDEFAVSVKQFKPKKVHKSSNKEKHTP